MKATPKMKYMRILHSMIIFSILLFKQYFFFNSKTLRKKYLGLGGNKLTAENKTDQKRTIENTFI